MKTIVGLMKRTLRYLQSNMTIFLKAAFPNNIFTKKLDFIFSHTDMESSTTQRRTGNFNDIQWFWQSWRSLADCGWTFFTMALGVHGGSHRVYGKPWRPKARKKGGEVQVSNQPETSNTTSRVLCHFPETPQRHGWVFGGREFLILDIFAQNLLKCTAVSCNSGLGLGLGFGFCLNLNLHWMKPGHHLSGNHFLGGGAGRLAGHSSNYFMSYFGCWNIYIVFSCPSSPTTTCDSNSTRTKTISPIFHWFSRGQQNNPPIPIPNQFEKPSSKTILECRPFK